MAPRRKESLVELCARVTAIGNTVAVRLLEYLGTVKQQPYGLNELANNFLEISRLIWAIEAGFSEASRTNTSIPSDVVQELEKKIRQTHDDFTVLNQMLVKFLEYEHKGRLGKFQKGWRMMFSTSDVDKIRESLGKSRDALKISGLMFQWTLGDEKAYSSVGIGYTGLAAVLERLNPVKPPPVAPVLQPPLSPPVTALPPVPSSPQPSLTLRAPMSPAPASPLPSVSTIPERLPALSHTLQPMQAPKKLPSYHVFPRDDETLNALATELERQSMLISSPSIRSVKQGSNSTARESDTSHTESSHTDYYDEDLMSLKTTESMNQIEDIVQGVDVNEKSHIQFTRINADLSTVPRWTPKQTSGANSASLKSSLVNAILQRNHKMVEQLLDCGVPPSGNPLKEAVLQRDADSVRLLLLFGADPNAIDRNGLTPLYSATETSFLDGAKRLLRYGANPNLPAGPNMESPLAYSVIENKPDLAQLYLTYGGDPNQLTSTGNTLLVRAMNKSTTRRMVDLLLGYGGDVNGKNAEGQTALFEAIQAKRIDLLSILLDQGADPNLPGPKHPLWPSTYQPQALQLLLSRGADFKKTPGILELATSLNNLDSVSILLRSGVDPNAKKDGVYTPLCTAIRDNRGELVTILLANGADPNLPASEYPAFKCVTHRRTHLLPQLVAAGSDLNSPKGIIEKAVAHKNKEALLYLLEQNVNPNDKTPEGHTALTTAIHENQEEFVDLLLANGADPSIRGQDWPICMAVKQPSILRKLLPAISNPRAVRGVMEMAVVANQLESIKLLLQAGVSIEDRNGGVFSPLTTAIREDQKEIVRFLLEAGADVNSPGEHLPIIKAIRRCRGNDTEIIQMLLARGADINLMYRGWNAVLQAVENGSAEILQILVEQGGAVDLQATDDSGKTVIEIVSERGWQEAVAILRSNSGLSHPVMDHQAPHAITA